MISNQKNLSPIGRRELLALVGAAVAFRPFTAVAQPGKVPTIGALVVGSPGAEQFWKLFRDAMQQPAMSKAGTSATSSGRIREIRAACGLMSYGVDEADVYRRAAVFADKILKGAKRHIEACLATPLPR